MARTGFTIWFSGLSASGKTTVSREVESQLRKKVENNIEVLDGDEIRKELNWDLGFSKEDRLTNLKRVSYITKILSRNGVIVIAAFICPYQEARDYARSLNINFIEVYIKCPLGVCETRDPKGMYKKARTGDIKKFTGISDPFEEPANPDIIVETDCMDPKECARKIVDKAVGLGYLE